MEGEQIKLTLTEFRLLTAVGHRPRPSPDPRSIDGQGDGTDVFVTDRAIDVHVTAIRKKLGEASYLVFIGCAGVGYRLQESPEENA